MDHNIFMKWIESIVVILNHSTRVVHIWKPCIGICFNKIFLVTQILKCLTVGNPPYWQNQQNLVKQILKWWKTHFSFTLIITYLVCSMDGLQTPLNTLQLLSDIFLNYFLSTYIKNVFLGSQDFFLLKLNYFCQQR